MGDCVKVCHQLGVIAKCSNMLLEDKTDGIGGVTTLDLDGKWILQEVFFSQLGVLDQGGTDNIFSSRRRVRRHMDTVNVADRGKGERYK